MSDTEPDETTPDETTLPDTPDTDGPPDETTAPDDTDAEGEADDETQAAPPLEQAYRTPEQIEASIASWDREKARHMRELEKRDDVRFGDSVECPLCDGHGVMYPVLPEPENTNRREFIAAALGGQPEAEYKPHPTEALCEACDGWGQVFTGSKVANQDLLNCPACQGMGHRPPSPAQTPVYTGAPPAVISGDPDAGLPYSTVPPSEQVRIGNDAYGRPPGHLHYGVHRPTQNAGQPAGVSA